MAVQLHEIASLAAPACHLGARMQRSGVVPSVSVARAKLACAPGGRALPRPGLEGIPGSELRKTASSAQQVSMEALSALLSSGISHNSRGKPPLFAPLPNARTARQSDRADHDGVQASVARPTTAKLRSRHVRVSFQAVLESLSVRPAGRTDLAADLLLAYRPAGQPPGLRDRGGGRPHRAKQRRADRRPVA